MMCAHIISQRLLFGGGTDFPAFYLVVANGGDAPVEERAAPGPSPLDPEAGCDGGDDEGGSRDGGAEDDDEGPVHCDSYAGHVGCDMSNMNPGCAERPSRSRVQDCRRVWCP